jgi:hypothetical protein
LFGSLSVALPVHRQPLCLDASSSPRPALIQGPRPDQVMRMSMAEVFRMRDGKICERRAWVIELKENDYR